MAVLHVFLSAIALLVSAPAFFFVAEIVAACVRRRSAASDSSGARPRLAVLVPAHNEQTGIAQTLKSIRSQLRETDRLVVIADNCTDATATLARRAGAIVHEREDSMRRGKGFALSFGLDRLASDPPEVVLFFDADCEIGPDAVDALAHAAKVRQRPVQANYLCEATTPQNARQAVGAFAFRMKNLVRMTGLSRLGGPSHLTGSGMGLPWKLVDTVPWATGNVVEDMQLGIDFALAGHSPAFVPEATVSSRLPESESGQLAQRRRWEHGFLATALSQVPELFGRAIERRSWSLLMMACDMTIPPLSLLMLVLAAVWCLASMAWMIGLGITPLAIFTLAIAGVAGSLLLGWMSYCREQFPLSLALQIPRYVLGKVTLYFEFLRKPEKQWVRAERPAARPTR